MATAMLPAALGDSSIMATVKSQAVRVGRGDEGIFVSERTHAVQTSELIAALVFI